MRRIVFVCSGNICRSPMAAGIAAHHFAQHNESVAVISCGTLHLQGKKADPHAIEVMREIGIDIDGHRSQGVAVGLLRFANDIVVMEPKHADYITRQAPDLADRIVRLWEFSPRADSHIHDPVGGDADAFRACRDELVEAIHAWSQG